MLYSYIPLVLFPVLDYGHFGLSLWTVVSRRCQLSQYLVSVNFEDQGPVVQICIHHGNFYYRCCLQMYYKWYTVLDNTHELDEYGLGVLLE